MTFLDRIAACNNADLSSYRAFHVAGQRVGWVGEVMAERLREFPEVFTVLVDSVSLNADIEGYDARTSTVDGVLKKLLANGAIAGWRDEPYPVGVSFAAEPSMQMERAAVPHFGIRAYGRPYEWICPSRRHDADVDWTTVAGQTNLSKHVRQHGRRWAAAGDRSDGQFGQRGRRRG